MRLQPAWLLLLAALTAPGAGRAADPGLESPCVAAATQAESERGLPPGLLTAIGRIESGRWNPATQRTEPWPWAVNAAGSGRYHPSPDLAINDVRREQAYGTRSVDVGCFQISLLHHPAAFASLDEAFDPLANARYAARFLQTLWTSSGSWEVAVGQYHSATPGLGEPYRRQVMASWESGGLGRGPSFPIAAVTRPLLGPVFGTTSLPDPRQAEVPRVTASGDPHVILVHATGTSIRVERGPSVPDVHVITFSRFLTRHGT